MSGDSINFGATAESDKWEQAIDIAERLQTEQQFGEARRVLLGAVAEASNHDQKECRLAYTFNNLGSVAQDQGQYLDAEQYYRRSITNWQHCGKGRHPGMARTLNNLASLMHSTGKWKQAENLLRRSEAVQIGHLRSDDPDAGVLYLNRATIYLARRNYKKAEESYRRAWAIWEQHSERHKWDMGRVARDLGLICERTGRKREAIRHYNAAREIWEEDLHAQTGTPEMYCDLASLLSTLGQKDSARSTIQQARKRAEQQLGARNPRTVNILLLYASILREQGSKADAARLEKQAKEIQPDSQARLAGQTIDAADLAPGQRK
jgi:tetratricopeptide (TPR) repeat protein